MVALKIAQQGSDYLLWKLPSGRDIFQGVNNQGVLRRCERASGDGWVQVREVSDVGAYIHDKCPKQRKRTTCSYLEAIEEGLWPVSSDIFFNTAEVFRNEGVNFSISEIIN
jgi:hypothetical protein